MRFVVLSIPRTTKLPRSVKSSSPTAQDVAIENEYAQSLCRESQRVISEAQYAQTSKQYNADDFQPTLLKEGTKIYRVCQDSTHLYQGAWYTTEEEVLRANFDYNSIYSGLQISDEWPNYKIAEYRLTQDVLVAYGKALANTQHGTGGFIQYYIADWEQSVVFNNIIYDLTNTP